MVLNSERIGQMRSAPFSRFASLALFTVALASVANLSIWLAAQFLLQPDPAFLPLNLGPVVFFSLAGAGGAALVYWLISRFSQRPAWLFRRVASVVLLLSFIPDISLMMGGGRSFPGTTAWTVAALALMHFATWAVCISMLTRLDRQSDVSKRSKSK